MRKNPATGLLLLLILIGLSSICFPSSASAQTGEAVLISAPETDHYPEITLYIDPKNRDGSSLNGLTADQVELTEDGIRREIETFQELQPGIQLVVALNISEPFAIQDINGKSRFDFIQEALLNWASQPLDSSPDDLSLVTNTGLEAVHLDDREQWIETLSDYSPELREVESNFQVLARAIEIASDPVDQPGMKRVVLLFSAQPASDSYPALDSLLSQALDNQVMVTTILVSSPAFFATEGALKINSLSQQTGGAFLPFSGQEPLADLGQLLNPLRSTYQLQYQSSIVSGETHTLEVTINTSLTAIVGQRQFPLQIQPPNPVFISPPMAITRSGVESDEEDPGQISFKPDSISLPVLIEFPDDHPRDLEELIFRVDDEIVQKVTAPPFDRVVWNLEDYQGDGTHYLTLEAVDIMGLSKLSIATPIEIKIDLPPESIGSILRRNGPALAGLVFILLLGMTLFILIAKGTIHPGERPGALPWLKNQGRRTAGLVKKILRQDPAPGSQEPEVFSAPYRLIPINDVSQQLFPQPITVHQKEILVGNHQEEGLLRIDHPSIIPHHARITLLEEGQFQISDLGSVAGTWINYQQIPDPESRRLKDGDIIHIGEAAFRFQLIPQVIEPSPTEENVS